MQTLHIERRGSVAWVAMDRPEVFNAFDETMIAELDAAFGELSVDASVRAIVLTGHGKAFSAGADLQWMRRAAEAAPEANLADARRLAAMLWRIASCPKPTLARVNGLALGGGVGLTCACDIAIAVESAQFAISEARFGIIPATIGPYVIGAIGKRLAKRLALRADRIGADDALRFGMLHRVVAADQLDQAIEDELAALLASGPQAQREIKALIDALPVGDVSEPVREATAQAITRVRATAEAREGFAAFLAKRSPHWGDAS